MEQHIEELLREIDKHPDSYPHILIHISKRLEQYRVMCKRQQDHDLRESLGDAVHLLGMPKKPAKKEMKNLCTRIEKTIFPEGPQSHHHQGERQFYEKYLKED